LSTNFYRTVSRVSSRWHVIRRFEGNMGWRAWDAYDTEGHARWKELPWRERYSWRTIGSIAFLVIIAAALWFALSLT
jgi:hypothetical protein